MKKEFHINFWYVVAAIIGVVLLRDLWTQQQIVTTIPYSEFRQYLVDGKIAEVAVGETVLQGRFREPTPGGQTHFRTVPVAPDTAEMLSK
jgi:cell division protease FtsH